MKKITDQFVIKEMEIKIKANRKALKELRKGKKALIEANVFSKVMSDAHDKRVTERLGTTNITRFKGLGEMGSQQLWETTMNPNTRKIKKIYIEDAVEADRIFSMLMGDDVQGRKDFISENAKEAELDI